ncbi:MAG: efflux RND transporter periplasmic adaptor subunit [Alphaproteobacteria bacterium]
MSGLLAKTRGYKLPLLAVIAGVFALVSVLSRSATPAREPLVTPPKGAFTANVAGIGVVEPKSEIIAIGTEISGVVREVQVTVGQQVRRGDALFTLDTRDIDAQIATLEASIETAKIQAKDAAAQYALIASVKDKRAVSKDDVNRRYFARAAAEAQVKEIRAKIAQAKTNRERLTVRAPIDGKILQLEVRPGEFASAGQLAVPLIRMGDVSTLHVRVEFDEENANRLVAGATGKAYHRGDTTHALPLSFVRFEPYVRPKQNLAVAGQRVDTRVLQVIFALQGNTSSTYVGEQMDVFIDATPAVAAVSTTTSPTSSATGNSK